MNRLIIVPQYPARLRYQEWWILEMTYHLRLGSNEIILLNPLLEEADNYGNNFAPIDSAIEYELEQIKLYMKLELKKGDILLLNDISFPGFFAQVLHHKRPTKCFAFCHATSKNAYDYFLKTRNTKFPIETASSKLFNKIFVGSEYHKKKLGWNNTIVTGLPDPPDWVCDRMPRKKEKNIVIAARKHIQKRTISIENKLKKKYEITEIKVDTWAEYYKQLAQHNVLLITSKEETYGYQVVDALLSDTHVLAPRAFSYPELLPDSFLYSNFEELEIKLIWVLTNNPPIPMLLMQDKVDNFYINLKRYLNE